MPHHKKSFFPPLATPSDLDGRSEITEHLNGLVADAFALYVKAKNFHWHVFGPHFRDYHLLLDEQADQIFAMIDPLAERVRKLGGVTIRSTGEICQRQRVKDEEMPLPAEKMLESLLKDQQEFVIHLRKAHQACEKYHDVATCSFLEVYIDETERRIWFLFETLSR